MAVIYSIPKIPLFWEGRNMPREDQWFDKIKNHFIYIAVAIAVAAGGTTYGIIDKLFVQRYKDDLVREEKINDKLKKEIIELQNKQPEKQQELKYRIDVLSKTLEGQKSEILALYQNVNTLKEEKKRIEVERNQLQDTLNNAVSGRTKDTERSTENNKKIIDDYQSKVKELEKLLSSYQAKNSTAPKKTIGKGSHVIVGDFTFLPDKCEKSGEKLYCYFIVVNNAPNERYIHIASGSWGFHNQYHSSVIDEKGNQFIASKIKFGGNDWKSADAYGMIPSKIPFKVGLEFPSFSDSASNLSLQLSVNTKENGVEWKNPVLREITLNE